MRTSNDIKPKAKAGRTNAQVYNQGVTYNEVGFTYDQANIAYGGIYDYDVYPMLTRARNVVPRIVAVGDFQGTAVAPSGNSGYLIGMLAMTYS